MVASSGEQKILYGMRRRKREQRRSKRNKLKKALICFKNKHLNSVIQALLVVVL